MALILILLGPAFYIIFRYELFGNFITYLFKNSSDDKEKSFEKLEKELKRYLEKLKLKRLCNEAKLEEIVETYQKERKALNHLIRKNEADYLTISRKRNSSNLRN
jgi:hypothetical protein